MNYEEKILQILIQMQADIVGLKEGQSKLEEGQSQMQTDIAGLKDGQNQMQTEIADLKQEQSKINIIIETEIRKNINLLVDGHMLLNEKLDRLANVKEEVDECKAETKMNRAAIKDIYRKIG